MADEFQTKLSGETLHVVVSIPRLDASSAALLKQHLIQVLEPGVKRAEIDLGAVQFIDSSGIGVLLSIYRKLPEDGSGILLRGVSPGVMAVIELLRLHRVFKFE